MENKTASFALWGAIGAAIIIASVTLYIHFDSKKTIKEKEKKLEVKQVQVIKSSKAQLIISDIYVPTVNTRMDSSFFAEIKNISKNNSKVINLKINFGETEILKCETLPNNLFNNKNKFNNSILNLTINNIKPNNKFYIYCFTSQPIFKSINISGENLLHNNEFPFESYKQSKIVKKPEYTSSGFYTFLKIITALIITWFSIHGVIIISSLLNRKFKL